jgi:uncharacterized protein YkwD
LLDTSSKSYYYFYEFYHYLQEVTAMKNAKRIAAFVIVLAMAFSMAHAFAADDETIDLRFSGTNNYTMAYEVLELVNKERTSRGLSAVSMDVDLLNTAMQRAAEIAIYYDHTRPDGTSCFTAFPARFEYSALGENIAIGQENSDEVMTDWMNSEGHRENILTAEYKSIGVGCFYQQGTIHWVQLFASDSARAPSPVPTNRIVNVSVSVAPGYCDLGLDLEEEGEDYQQAYLYNTNPEFPYSYIILSNDNVRYSSADSGVVKVSEGGVIPASEKMGFVQLACYIDGTLVYETASCTLTTILHQAM